MLVMLTAIVSLPGYCSCQHLGEYCGSPATETFPSCCPFDTDSDDKQVPLECENIDNGVGTCEIKEEKEKD